MKKILAFTVSLVFFIPFAISSVEEAYYSDSYARLSYIKGDVFVQKAGDLGYEEGVVNLPVVEGDKLGTREGRAEIHFGRKNYLRINKHTQIDFINLPRKGYDQIKLHVLSGNVFLRINYLGQEKAFEIHTPDASFYVLEEGLFSFEVGENGETEIFVYEGAVEAAGEEGSLLVEKEERLIVSNGHFRSDPVSFFPSFDDSFSRWNRTRDSLHARAVSRRYLPSELYEYEQELDSNGHWVYERSYGYVWVPYVYHNNWRPYYYGRWVWYPIIGWTWVSYESWGWCVYHYGRWHWRLGLGWYWIPSRHWGPAWVHWYSGYDYIGWCPLSYYGYPGVIVNNRFYGRHYGRYYPVHSRALTVIRRNHMHARRISNVALSHKKISRLRKIALSANQPRNFLVPNRASHINSKAKKVLSRSQIRSVRKSFGSKKAGLSSVRMRSSGLKKSSLRSSSINSSGKVKESLKRLGNNSNSKISSRTSKGFNSRSSVSNSRATSRITPGYSKSRRSKSTVKTYPSRSSFSSSTKRSFSSKRSRSDSTQLLSSRSDVSRSKVKAYPQQSRSLHSVTSRVSSSRKGGQSYSRGSIRSQPSRAKSSFKRSSSRRTFSSSSYSTSRRQVRQKSSSRQRGFIGSISKRKGSSFSRTSSAGRKKISSSKSYSSQSRNSRISRSKSSRPSKRSSSSRSVSRKKIGKR